MIVGDCDIKNFHSLQFYFDSFIDFSEKRWASRIFSFSKLPSLTSDCKIQSSPNRDFTYSEMLLMLREQLNIKNKKTPKFTEPEIFREGKSKTIFANFHGLCLTLQRDKKHVMQFIRDELMVKCSLDVESTKMVIEGGFKRQDIAKIIDQYKTFFVICHSCNCGPITMIKHNQGTS